MGIGKRFVNSMVSQIGRDTGRVVSNSLYGDAHSVPIRVVSDKCYNIINGKFDEIPLGEARDILAREGYHSQIKMTNMAIVIFLFIISIGWILFSPALFIWRGYVNLNKKYVNFSKQFLVSMNVSDRRFKTGLRPAGYSSREETVKIPITPQEHNIYKERGKLYIALGVISLIIQIVIITVAWIEKHP